MAAVTPPQLSIAAGEIGPELWGRSDLQWHNSAARELENFLPTPWGPIRFSGGLRFIAEVDDSADTHRLIPFRFSVDDAYMLILGDQTIRFGRNKAIITSGSPVTLAAGDGVPWPHTALASIRSAQSADVLYMAHPSYKMRELRRASHTSWTIPAFDFKDGPYYPENTTARTITLSSTSGSVTVTLSNADAVNNGQGFLVTDIGRLIRWKDPANNWTWLEITAHTSTTVVTATIRGPNASAGTATAAWRMGLWSDTTGWPAAVAIHQGRLAVATNALWSLPRVDLSMSGALDTFSPSLANGTVNDDNAVACLISSGEVPTIRDIKSLRDLIVFAAGGDFRVTSGSTTEPITPTNVEVRPITAHGTANVAVVPAHTSLLYVQRDGRTVNNLKYSIEADYDAKDMNVRAPHIGHAGRADAEGGFGQLAWALAPLGQMLATRNDGQMPVLTFLPEQEVYAWARHRRADTLAGATFIESVACIPYGGVDQPWVIAKRTIGGATKRYVEILEEPLGRDDPIEDAFYVDSGLTLDQTGTVLGFGTLTPGTGANVVDTADVLFTASVGGFTTGHVGRKLLYRYKDTADPNTPDGRHPKHKHIVWATGYATITERVSGTVVKATINEAWPAAVVGTAIAAGDWRMTAASVSGLDHLNGETVQVWGDGAPQDEKTVSAGAITLETDAATVQVGLGYTGRFDPILTDIGSRQGTRHGKTQKIAAVSLYLHRSVGGRVRVPASEDGGAPVEQELIPFRYTDDKLAEAIQPWSGWTDPIPVPGDWSKDPYLLIEQDIPGPFEIRAIVPKFEVNDG